MTTRLVPIDAEGMRIAAAGVAPLPIEQSAVWESFEASQGHRCWGRFEWYEGNKRCAVISLYLYSLRGAHYLWAKHGPVWLKEATPEREAAFRADLQTEVRKRDRSLVFIRLNAIYSAPDLSDVLQTITYDRTVIIDTSGGTEESVLASMTTDGKRAVRRAKKKMAEKDGRIVEETEAATADFSEYYAVLEETAERDGFSPHPMEYYAQLLTTLGPDHARMFTVRVGENNTLVCWDLILVHDKNAVAFYGASTSTARQVLGPDALDFGAAVILAKEGIVGLDLMGAHSPRVPELFRVGKYKQRYAQQFTDVAGGWDLPLRPNIYRGLQAAIRLKQAAKGFRSNSDGDA
ncbi:MAG: GNAT family N-acetyltransferase [Actinobacteria bacterium]|nr:MAG: GNAT family N-acetyltransferase [Actinomycetota bacterium]